MSILYKNVRKNSTRWQGLELCIDCLLAISSQFLVEQIFETIFFEATA